MKTVKSTLLFLLALSSATVPPQANAYFAREEVEVCEDEELNTGIGVVAGGVLGAAAGFFLGGRNPLIATGAGLGGAALGGILGNAASCEQRKTYYGHLMNHISSPNYRQPFEARGIRIVVTREGYARWGEYCRTYHMDYVNSRGQWVEEERTTCLNHGKWRVGYDSDAIHRVIWNNSGPTYRESHYRPSWEYRMEYDYSRPHYYDHYNHGHRRDYPDHVTSEYNQAPRGGHHSYH